MKNNHKRMTRILIQAVPSFLVNKLSKILKIDIERTIKIQVAASMLHLWLPLTCNSNSIYSNPVKHANEGPYRWVRKSHSSIAGQRKYLVQIILISINKKIKKNNFRVAEFRSLNTILRITLEDTRSSKMLV